MKFCSSLSIASPAAVILAAGASTRLGRAKQLEAFNGTTLLEQAVATTRAAGCETVVVVLGSRAEIIGATLAGQNLIIEINRQWPIGMGGSIRCGVRAVLRRRPDAASVLLLPCDQPYCTAADLRKLLDAVAAGHAIAASGYSGTRGTPACFAPSQWPSLLAIDFSTGAKKLLHDPSAVLIDMPAAAFDVDTPDDAAKLKRMTAETQR